MRASEKKKREMPRERREENRVLSFRSSAKNFRFVYAAAAVGEGEKV